MLSTRLKWHWALKIPTISSCDCRPPHFLGLLQVRTVKCDSTRQRWRSGNKRHTKNKPHTPHNSQKTKGFFAAPRSLIGRTNAIWTASMRCGGLHRFAWGIWAWQGTNWRLTMIEWCTRKTLKNRCGPWVPQNCIWKHAEQILVQSRWVSLKSLAPKKKQNGIGSHLHATIRTPQVERLVVLLHRPRRALPSQWSGLWYSSPDEHVPTDSGMFGVETKVCSKSTSKASHQRLYSNAMCSLDLEWTITKNHSSSKGQLLAKKKVNLMGETLPRRSIQGNCFVSLPIFLSSFFLTRFLQSHPSSLIFW